MFNSMPNPALKIGVPKSMIPYLTESDHQVLDMLGSIASKLNLERVDPEPVMVSPDKLGFDDNDIVAKGANLLFTAAMQIAAWWKVARIATCLREHDLILDGEDIDTMCQRFLESDGDLDYVFGYLVSPETMLAVHAIPLNDPTWEYDAEIDVTGTRPHLPDISELKEIDEALDRVRSRYSLNC